MVDTCDSYSMALVRPQARDSGRNPASAGGWGRLRILPLTIILPWHTHMLSHVQAETGNNEHYWREVINYWACSLQLVFKWFCPAGSARVVHLTSTLRPIDYSGQQLYFPAVESTATTVYVQEPAIVERSVSLPFPRVILITGGLSCCTHTWHATWLLYHLLELPTPALPMKCSSNISLPR